MKTIALFLALLFTPAAHAGLASAQSLWQFDDSLANNITGGGALVPANLTEAFTSDTIGGQTVRVLDLPALNQTAQALTMPVTGGGNGDSPAPARVNQWSVVMDIKMVGTLNDYSALIQADNGGDAEVFVTNDGRLYFNTKFAPETSAAGVISPLQWNRVAVTCGNDGAGGPLTVRAFVNGVKVLEASGQDFNGNFSMLAPTSLFGDNSGETSALHCNSLAFWTETLSETDIAVLGSPVAIGIPISLYVVTNTDDAGPGSLRDTIATAPAGGTVVFAPALSGGSIPLASQLTVDKDITIDALALPGGITITDTGETNYSLISAASSAIVLRGLTLSNGGGSTATTAGAGIYSSSGSLTLDQCTIADCTGAGGSAIYNLGGTVTLTRCTLSGNTARNSGGGGAIYNLGTVVLTNCTLVGNAAGDAGGAIYSLNTVTATHCTFANNQAGAGGAIYNHNFNSTSSVVLTNCIVADNTALAGAGYGHDIYNAGGTITLHGLSLSHGLVNAIGSGVMGSITGDGGYLDRPALLAPLGTYGGRTQTMPPTADSEAIDQAGGTSETTDQRGLPRGVDGGSGFGALPDIGAVEVQVSLVTTAADESNGSTNGTSLREAIADTSGHADIIRFDPAVFNGEPADVIRLTVVNGLNKEITVARSLSVDARNLHYGLTISGDTNSSGTANSGDTRIFRINPGQTVALYGLTLQGGYASFGGGIYNNGTLTVNQCSLPGNYAIGGAGGGIYNPGTLTVNQSTLSGNYAISGANGGGIYNGGTLTVNQSTFSGNHAVSGGGGGIYNYNTLTVNQSTLSANQGATGGGGIENFGSLTVKQSTLSGNDTGYRGGGIDSASSSDGITLTNSLIAGNTAVDAGPDVYNTGFAITTNGRNLIGDISSSSLSASGTLLTGDAQLAPAGLASNGGLTQTIALLPSSPAIDAALSSTFTTDQRGLPMVGTADLGAYESSISAPSPAHAANIAFANPTLSWTGPAGASFTVFFGTSSGSLTSLGSTDTTSSLALPSQLALGTYYWRVDATLGSTTFPGPEISFTVQGVTSTADDGGPLTLRQLLADAAANPGPDVIVLGAGLNGQTLTLLSELIINDSSGAVTIDASALSNGFTLTDSGNVNYRLLHVQAGSTLIVKGLTFANGGGGALTGDGGAILNEGTLSMDLCTVSGCQATMGGGIANKSSSGTASLAMTRCTVTANTSTATGGGIFSYSENTGVVALSLTGCSLDNNASTTSNGGAVSSIAFGTTALASAAITNCTFLLNRAQLGQGGAFFNFGQIPAHATAELRHCTMVINTSGIDSMGILTLANSILISNTLDVNNHATVVTNGLNFVNTFANALGAVTTVTGPTPSTLNPKLGTPGYYGNATISIPLLPGSPAIDQAPVLNPAVTMDQRGQARPLGAGNDVGAMEGTVIVVNTPVDELDAPGALGNGVSLREAVRDVEAGGTIVFDRAVFNSTTTNTITLTKGPLNPPRNCTLDGSANPGGISILNTLTITAQPQLQSVADDDSASFTVAVTALSGGMAYQWRKDGSDLSGKTAATYTIFNAMESDEALYDVTLSEAVSTGAFTLTNVNLTPASARSQPASLVVNGSPVYVQRGPQSAMLALGSSYTLSVNAIGPALPALTYQWIKAGKNISGATNSSLTFAKAALANAGAYTCLVKSGATSVTSSTAEIGVVDATMKIVNLKVGGKFSATVNAAGNGASGVLGFAWHRVPVEAAPLPTTQSFTLPTVAVADAGLYTCTVTGLAGTFTGGAPTLLNVSDAAPQFTLPLALPAATIGQAYYYQLPVQSIAGAPATAFSMTGKLPAGMVFNKVTGVLSGRPTTSKVLGYQLSFKASNAFTSSLASSVTLMVNIVPTTGVGTFAGPAARSPLNDNLGGRFDMTTTASGLFSGSVTLGARSKLSFKNELLLSAGAGDVILRGNLTGIAMADKTPLIAYVEVFATDQRATLTLIHPNGTTLVIPAWRNPWLLSKTLALNNPATAYAAYYTARLDCGTAANTPNGYGYASFTVSTAGTLTLAGKLPDGSAVTGGAFVSKDGEIAVFNLLYGATNQGSHVGQLLIKTAPTASTTLGGTTTWFKPPPLATSTDTVYKAGFGPITVTTEGAPYVAPGKGAIVPGFTAVMPGQTNAKLDFTLGGLDTEAKEFPQLLRIANPSASSVANTAVIAAPISNATKMTTFTASSGLFSGSFTINGATTALNRNAPFYGQLVTNGTNTQGYGFFLLPQVPVGTEKVTTSPKLSGSVVLGLP